ncbi:hypothetical protein CS535_12065 [Yersinia massiliensis]|nr:hypothetical protein CS535_12065 [Yersinia massiliensis]
MATLFELGKVEVVRVKKSSPGGDYTHLSIRRGRMRKDNGGFGFNFNFTFNEDRSGFLLRVGSGFG